MKKLLLLILALTVLSGCGILMPYEQDFACNIPQGMGMCGSVTAIYDATTE